MGWIKGKPSKAGIYWVYENYRDKIYIIEVFDENKLYYRSLTGVFGNFEIKYSDITHYIPLEYPPSPKN